MGLAQSRFPDQNELSGWIAEKKRMTGSHGDRFRLWIQLVDATHWLNLNFDYID